VTRKSLYRDPRSFLRPWHPRTGKSVSGRVGSGESGAAHRSKDNLFAQYARTGPRAGCGIAATLSGMPPPRLQICGYRSGITSRKLAEENLRRTESVLADSERWATLGRGRGASRSKESPLVRANTIECGVDPGDRTSRAGRGPGPNPSRDQAAVEARHRALSAREDFDLVCRILLPGGAPATLLPWGAR